MAAAEKPNIQRVQNIPNPPPNHNQTDNYGRVFDKISKMDFSSPFHKRYP
jgi:hypothetical protein